MSNFVHLGLHTEYSLKDSTLRIPDVIKSAKDKGMGSIAISDVTNLFGAIRFYSKAKAAGIKPIIGSELLIDHPQHGRGILRVYCQNGRGYKNLMKVISSAYETVRIKEDDIPVIPLETLVRHQDGLIALSGAQEGHVGKLLLEEAYDVADNICSELSEAFGGRFYLELQRTGHPDDDNHVERACALAARLRIPVVATNNVRFLDYNDHKSHEIRRAIASSMTVDQLSSIGSSDKKWICSPEQYLKSPEEMEVLFSDIPTAISNTLKIAEKCSIDIELGKNYLPSFPVPEGMSESDFLTTEAEKGLNERLDFLYGKDNPDIESIRKSYDERLAYELGVINQMGFPGYFLIVSDFIRWSKENDIPVGPGRGSGAGSLVAYSLQITDLDPLHYDLLFERFLNPERVSMPDFDVDFCMDKRDQVIDYVAKKYGRKAVSQIITYGTMAAKSVVRDVARALGKPYSIGDRIARMIPSEPGIKLSDVMERSVEFETTFENDSEAREIITHALELEGLTRQTGKHAGGVLIAPSELTEFTPTYAEADGQSGFVSQYDKDDVELAGLVKFDFLGLRTLTIIQNALKSVNKTRALRSEDPIDILGIDLDDKKAYDLIKSTQTTAVFQLESRGMKSLIHKLSPENIEEIIALVALFRPGPLQAGMVDDFVNRKHGRASIDYPHPDLKPILENTYGVFVYQEQVMQTAQALAGYTLGQADMLRRAMGKKKPEEMEKQRKIFTEGCEGNGIPTHQATSIFDLMEKFAGYGFNKSHSAAYGLIAYQTAWLKAHYPAEFMAAVLSSDMGNTDKVVGFIHECKSMGLEVLPPNINKSQREFVPTPDGKILYGLEAVKGIGESAIEPLLEERIAHGEFDSLHDFCARVNPKKRVIESAIYAGLLDEFGINRATLMENWSPAREIGKQLRKQDSNLTGDLFGQIMEEKNLVKMNHVADWAIGERLKGERKTLGLFLTGHPMEEYEGELAGIVDGKINDHIQRQVDESDQEKLEQEAVASQGRKRLKIAGVITDLQIKTGKNGHTAFATLDDGTAQIPLIIFNKTYNMAQPFLKLDSILVIDGELRHDRRSNEEKLIANKIETVEAARNNALKSVIISIDAKVMAKDQRERISLLLDNAEDGAVSVFAKISRDGRDEVKLLTKKSILLTDYALRELKKICGEDSVRLEKAGDINSASLSSESDSTKDQLKVEGSRTAIERHNRIAQLLDSAATAMA